MKMKRMIISPAQLKMINETALKNNGSFSNITDLNTQISKNQGSGTYTNSTALNKGLGGSIVVPSDQLDDPTTQNQIMNNASVSVVDSNKTNESRFSKRQVELGRLLEMRKNGKVFSKRQLNEMFMETQENAERLRREIGKCRLYDIFDAIEEVFPEELENAKNVVMSGADLPEFLCSLFSKEGVDSDREEEFLDMLGI